MTEIAPWKDRLADFLDRALGRLVVDTVGFLGADRLSAARIVRVVELADKTEARLAQKGVTNTRKMLLKHLHPILEEASLEDDDDLHSLWARLLAEALDPAGADVDKIYIGVLKELRPADAGLLRFMWEHRSTHVNMTYGGLVQKTEVGYLIPFNMRNLSHVADANDRTVRHLFKLGLIRPSPVKREVLQPKGVRTGRTGDEMFERVQEEFYSDLDEFRFTEFGLEFCGVLMSAPAAARTKQPA